MNPHAQFALGVVFGVLIAGAGALMAWLLFSKPDDKHLEHSRASADPYDTIYAQQADHVDQERRQ